MMITAITPSLYADHGDDLNQIYHLRYKILCEGLGWQLDHKEGLEKDVYDETHTTYLVFKDETQKVRGALRFIPMTSACMFDGPFQNTLPSIYALNKNKTVEVSRMVVDDAPDFSTAQKKKVRVFIVGPDAAGASF